MTTTPNQTTREEISGEMREKADQVAAALRNLHGLPVIATESDTQPGRSALWMDNGMAGAGQVAISTGEFPCAQTTALATLVNVAASFDFDALIAALQSPTDREGDRLLREVRNELYLANCGLGDGRYTRILFRIDAHLSRSIVGEGE